MERVKKRYKSKIKNELNKYLIDILQNINFIDNDKLNFIFIELKLQKNLNLFDLETEAILIRIFNQKEWNNNDKKSWCNFIKYLFEENRIKEPLLIQRLKETNVIKKEFGGWNNEEEFIDCSFLDIIVNS